MKITDFLGQEYRRLLRPSGGCHDCPLRRRKPTQFVPATLRPGKVLWLGEAPGKTEVEEGEGFVGASGQLLRRLAREASVPEPWSFSNTVHCRPPGNADPKARAVECCLSQFVLDEIRGYEWVVLVGAVPLRTLFPGARAKKFRGNVAWHPDFPGQRFFAIYHPAYILRRRDMEGDLTRQLQRLGRLVRGEDEVPWQVLTGDHGEAYWDAVARALSAPVISLDVETNNKLQSWHVDARVISIAVTADAQEVVFAHEDDDGWVGFREQLKAALQTPGRQVVGHNVAFDLDFLERDLGFRSQVGGIHDSMSVFYEAEGLKMPGLKELASVFLDGYRWLVHQPGEATPQDLLTRYNAEDVVHPLGLVREGLRRVGPKTRDLLVRVAGPASYVLRKMTSNGIHLRQDHWRAMIEKYRQRREAAIAAWCEEDPAFVPTEHEAGDGLIRYLHEIKGLPVLQRTGKTGKPSTDKSVIKALVRDHGATYLRHLIEVREVDKIRSTYLEAYRKHLDVDGRIHSDFVSTWTDSGRTSSRNPNLQNVPRVKEIRDLFGPRPGGVLLNSDLSQIEFRIMVCLAQDAQAIEGYMRGEDAHTMTARSFCAGDEPTKDERNRAKAINFALLYEGDWYNVQRTALDWYGLRWSETECRRFVQGFFTTYPRIPSFHDHCHRKLERNRGWFESVTGHRHHYEDWDHQDRKRRDHAHRSAINAEAQGPAAQICLLIGVHTDRLLQERDLGDVLMVNHVHDSLMFDVPDPALVDPVVQAVEDARAIAEQWIRPWFPVPLVVDHEVGPSWGNLTKWTPSR